MLIILSKFVSAEDYDSIVNMAAKLTEKGETVTFLHIQDACVAATLGEHCDRLLESRIDVLALKPDAETRGLTEKMCPNVKTISYGQWVNLLMNDHSRIVSWTT